MKYSLFVLCILLFSCKEKSVEMTAETKKSSIQKQAADSGLPPELQEEEDCDDKIKKQEKEFNPESFGLNKDAGCTIE